MTEDTTLSKPERHEPLDRFLQSLVELVNVSETAEIGIMLNVGGVIVSGQLVGGDRYFLGIASEVKQELERKGDPLAEDTYQLYAGWSETYTQRRQQLMQAHEASEQLPVETNELPHYVHLKNARFYHQSGAPIPSNQGVWWRGRLEAVDGFCFGALSAEVG